MWDRLPSLPATWFVLKDHQKTGMAFGGILITGTVLVWANLDTPEVGLPPAVPGVIIPLWSLDKAIRKAKQD